MAVVIQFTATLALLSADATGAAQLSAPVELALPGHWVRPPEGEGAAGDSGGAFSARQRAMMRAASAMRGPGRTTASESPGPNTHSRFSRMARMLAQPGYGTMACMLRLPIMMMSGFKQIDVILAGAIAAK